MRRFAILALGVLLMTTGTAFAQDSKGEFSAGYHALHVSGDPDGVTYGKGWYADVAGNLSQYFSVVGEVAGSYRSDDVTRTITGLPYTGSVDFSVHSFMGGVRLRAAGVHPNLVPFGQILFGGAHQKASTELKSSAAGGTLTFNDDVSDNSGTMSLDGGVDVNINRSIGARVSVGYMRFFADPGTNGFRVNVGVVVPF